MFYIFRSVGECSLEKYPIVKKYTVGLMLRTKFKRIIDMKEKFAQNREVPVSLMEFLLQTQGSFGGFFCLKFYILRCFLGE